MSIGDAEIKTQERVIRFFKDPEILGYQYIGNLSDYQNKNIKEDRLRQYLRLKGYADKLIDAAVMQLQQEAGNLSRGVYDANKTVYSRLKYGIPVSEIFFSNDTDVSAGIIQCQQLLKKITGKGQFSFIEGLHWRFSHLWLRIQK